MIRLGTRGSALALAQSQQVADALAHAAGEQVELITITSEGDVSRASLADFGGQGVFATRLREALQAGECDVLVHSLKDLPTAPAPGLVVGAIPAREDARDVAVTRDGTGLHELPAGAVVGTGSPRRIAQLRIRNPRVRWQDIRGNVDSRLARVRSGELDAVILAAAGLARLGGLPADLAGEALGLAEWPSAAGQGALAIEIREDAAPALRAAVAALDDEPTRLAVTAERAVLAGLEAGCHAPVGIHAQLEGELLRVRAIAYALDGSARVGTDRTSALIGGYAENPGSGDGANAVGDADIRTRAQRTGAGIARELLARGAAEISQ
ncbi:MAG: hydroxymethylbilane synthase [Microbacterium sp.]|uniref:hydroxymethylbilane synthase n=1 Tax=Microbacterium sp. TaxID=51671 RepID=UPI0039E2D685